MIRVAGVENDRRADRTVGCLIDATVVAIIEKDGFGELFRQMVPKNRENGSVEGAKRGVEEEQVGSDRKTRSKGMNAIAIDE